MDIGTTVEVEFIGCSDGYFKAENNGNRFSIAGKGSVGDTRTVRIVKKKTAEHIHSSHRGRVTPIENRRDRR